MAESKSLQEGQIALKCNFCEETNQIKLKCLQCDSLLCSKCGKVHQRVKSNDKHTIIELKDIAKYKGTRELGQNRTGLPFQITEQYISDKKSVNDLACCLDGTLWAYNVDLNILENIVLRKGVISKVRILHLNLMRLYNMAMAPSGDLFLSFYTNRIHVIPCSTGKLQESTLKTSSITSITTAIHVTKDETIIIGVREQGEPFPPIGPRQVIVMNKNGSRHLLYHYDNKGKPMFTLPFRITADSKNNLCVVDALSRSGESRLVLLSYLGKVKGHFYGERSLHRPFSPSAIVTTPLDNIIAADDDNNLMLALNYDGRCLYTVDTRDFRLQFPLSLAIDKNGMLYIGNRIDREKDKNGIANIFIAKFGQV